jgi:signal transduction histidine kinase
MGSLRSRLSIGLATSLAAVFVVQWLVVTLAIREVAESYVASRLEHDSDSLVAALVFDAAGRPALQGARLGAMFERPYSGHYYRVAAGQHVLRSRSLWDQDLAVAPTVPGTNRRERVTGPQEQTLLVLTRGVAAGENRLTISVAEDLTPLTADLRRLNLHYALISGAALVLLLVVQGIALQVGLRPLARIRAELEQVARGERERLEGNAPQEIQPLVHELNVLFTALRERLERSRRALGNLAHALKTPLTVLTDLSGDKRLRRWSDIQRPFAANTEMIARLIDRELKRARLAGAAPGGTRVELKTELATLRDTMQTVHRDKVLAFDLRAPPGPVEYAADREDVLELLGNVLDNACKWARSAVHVTVEPGEQLRILVEDDGPGCPTEQLQQITRRGVRLDESAPGHGLGLAIAQDIVASYNGRLTFGRSRDLGGLRVTILLPAVGAVAGMAQAAQ